MRGTSLKWRLFVSVICAASIYSSAEAGKIVSVPSATGAVGFGGWNLDNISVIVKDEALIPIASGFDPIDGSYDPGYFTFDSNIYDGSPVSATLMGVLHGKDFPVGEPSGIKIINDDTDVKAPKAQNCIMTSSYLEPDYLDTAAPVQTLCSSPFQSHKRFKVNMLPDSIGAAVDLVFNIDRDLATTDYQVFQKINNYTNRRLEGFTVQVGTGVGSSFSSAGDTALINANFAGKLSLSAPLKTLDPINGIWDPDQLATFSHGLFGAIDKNFPENGFFDDKAAGFNVLVKAPSGLVFDTFESDSPFSPSNYAEVPPASGNIDQFGPWLYAGAEPTGIFFDDDGDPATDAALKAFWGETSSGLFAWMLGNADGFAAVDAVTLNSWATDPLYFTDGVEDLLNLGLNYNVTIGVVDDTWPTWDGNAATFTIRIIPKADTSGILPPGYTIVPNQAPPLTVTEIVGVVSVSPSPEFKAGESLIITVADGDAVMAPVSVTNLTTGEVENSTSSVIPGVFAMVEVDPGRKLFQGELPTSSDSVAGGNNDGTLYVDFDHVIRVTYSDASPMGDVNVETKVEAENFDFFVIPLPNKRAVIVPL